MTYFGQFNQDGWVVEEVFNFKKGGFFLDLAAYDGVAYSNTLFLEKNLGWKGICIEADDNLFKKLKKNRKCICEHACIDGKSHKVKFTKFGFEKMGGFEANLYGGIISPHTDNKRGADFIWKDTKTLKEVLDKNNAPKIIDYFSLDVEGAETRILKNFPFNEYKFLSMSIERPTKMLQKILKKNKYVLIGKNPNDMLYVHKSLFKKFSLKQKLKIGFTLIKWQLLRDSALCLCKFSAKLKKNSGMYNKFLILIKNFPLVKNKRKNYLWNNHKNLTDDYKNKLYNSFMDIAETEPISCNPRANVELHTVMGHHHLFMYLLAVKSLLRFYNNFAVIAHDGDGDLTNKDIKILSQQIPGIKIIFRKDADKKVNKILNNLPRSQKYRSEIVNSLELFDNNLLAKRKKIITMNSDVLFLKEPKELIDWIKKENREIIYVYEDSPTSQKKFLSSIGSKFPPHVTLALVCGYKDIFDLNYIERLLGTKIAKEKPWPIGQCIYPALLEKASKTYNIRSFNKEEFDASGVFREGSVFRHYWSSTGRFTEIQIDNSRKVIRELKNLKKNVIKKPKKPNF